MMGGTTSLGSFGLGLPDLAYTNTGIWSTNGFQGNKTALYDTGIVEYLSLHIYLNP